MASSDFEEDIEYNDGIEVDGIEVDSVDDEKEIENIGIDSDSECNSETAMDAIAPKIPELQKSIEHGQQLLIDITDKNHRIVIYKMLITLAKTLRDKSILISLFEKLVDEGIYEFCDDAGNYFNYLGDHHIELYYYFEYIHNYFYILKPNKDQLTSFEHALYNICIIYCDDIPNYTNLENLKYYVYYHYAIFNNKHIFSALGRYYAYFAINYWKAKYYFMKCGCAECLYNIAFLALLQYNQDDFEYYSIECIRKDSDNYNDTMYEKIEQYVYSGEFIEIQEPYLVPKQHAYIIALLNDIDTDFAKLKIVNLISVLPDKLSIQAGQRKLQIFKNKLSVFGKNDKCPICLIEDTKCIPFECTHFVCIKCYPKIVFINNYIICPICRCVL